MDMYGTVLTLNDTRGIPKTGTIVINNEAFSYSGKKGNTLTGLIMDAQILEPMFFYKAFRFKKKRKYVWGCFKAKHFGYKKFVQSDIGCEFAWGHKRRYETFCPYSRTRGPGIIDKYAFGSNKNELIKEITYKYEITTSINTQEMNSVMGIGKNIVFIYEGKKWWEGDKEDILHTDNKELNDFVYATKSLQKLREEK